VNQDVLTLTASAPSLGVSLGFEAAAVIIDNFTSEFVQLTDAGRTVPPWTAGAVVPMPAGIRNANAVLVATTPAVPGPPVPIVAATLTWTDEPLPAAAGNLLTQSVINQPQKLGTVVGSVGASTTQVFTLPAGTQSVGFTTVQSGGGSLTGTASLTFEDDNQTSESLYYQVNPVITNGWAFVPVSQLPTNAIAVVLDMTGMTGANGQFTTTVVALPYSAAVGVTTFAGASVAIKPSSGNLIMAVGDNQQFYGSVSNPGAGAAIVSTGALAVGHYRVRVRCGYGHTPDSLEDNMKLVLAGVSTYTTLRVPQVADGPGVDRLFENLNVTQAAALHVEAIAAHTAPGAIYWASLDVTPLSSS
jgi:hypothetical protein